MYVHAEINKCIDMGHPFIICGMFPVTAGDVVAQQVYRREQSAPPKPKPNGFPSSRPGPFTPHEPYEGDPPAPRV